MSRVLENTPRTDQTEAKKPISVGNPFDFLASLDKLMHMDKMFQNGVPLEYMPRIGFVFGLCLVYIWLNHKSNNTIIALAKAKNTLEDMRVQYITQKSEYMFKSKQSEVAKMVAPLGLIEPKEPPSRLDDLAK